MRSAGRRWEADRLHNSSKGRQIAATGMPKPKVQDKKKVLLRLWKYLYQHKWMLLFALALTLSSNLLALLGPMLSGLAIDAIGTTAGGVQFGTVFYYCALMIVFYVLSSALSYGLSVWMVNLSQKLSLIHIFRAGVKHWHGAAKDSWFAHLAVEVPGENTSNEWLEPVTDTVYNKLK